MKEYSHEQSEKDVSELTTILRVWHSVGDSDSVEIQNIRKNEFGVGLIMAESLIANLQPERQLILKIGSKAVEGFSFRKGPYDTRTTIFKDFEPGYELPIKRVGLLTPEYGRPPQDSHYLAGQYALRLVTAAETLRDGGLLRINQLKATEEAKNYVDGILAHSWTEQGVIDWWQRPRYQLKDADGNDRAPAEIWQQTPQVVIDLAIDGRDQNGT